MESNQDSQDNNNQQENYLEYMDDIPFMLSPIYITEQPNQSIILHQGSLEITQTINDQKSSLPGQGTVTYEWFPHPSVRFNFEAQKSYLVSPLENGDAELTLSNLNTSVEIYINNITCNPNQNLTISGQMQKPVVQETGENLKSLIFHVVNFYNYISSHLTKVINNTPDYQIINSLRNRVVLKAENWQVTLDQLKTTDNNTKLLKNQGGYAITHVGKLEKLDGAFFKSTEAKEFLDMLADFLSFARGLRVPLIFLVGYDVNDNRIWEQWDSQIGHSWQSVRSWFPIRKAEIIADVFPGFVSWYRNWEESERLAFYWYLEANIVSLIEQKILLTQIALELMSWIYFVEKEAITSSDGFDKLPASDKFKLLLAQFKIPLAIPNIPLIYALDDLHKLASQRNNKWTDGCHALTSIRNGIVHPKKSKRQMIQNANFDSKYEAAMLGLWYLELLFLAIFDYKGVYHNRLNKNGSASDTEPVPWS